jgi:hypothetical protein
LLSTALRRLKTEKLFLTCGYGIPMADGTVRPVARGTYVRKEKNDVPTYLPLFYFQVLFLS